MPVKTHLYAYEHVLCTFYAPNNLPGKRSTLSGRGFGKEVEEWKGKKKATLPVAEFYPIREEIFVTNSFTAIARRMIPKNLRNT